MTSIIIEIIRDNIKYHWLLSSQRFHLVSGSGKIINTKKPDTQYANVIKLTNNDTALVVSLYKTMFLLQPSLLTARVTGATVIRSD